MKTKKLFKSLAFATAFGLSFVGFSVSTSAEKFAGEEVTVHSISLSSQAAACGSAESGGGGGGYGWGVCNGFGRCAINQTPGQPGDCMP